MSPHVHKDDCRADQKARLISDLGHFLGMFPLISATGFLIDEKIFAYRSFHITPLYFYKRSYAVLVVHSELHTVFYMRISFLLNLRSFYDVDSNRISKIDLYDKYRFFQKIYRQIRRSML